MKLELEDHLELLFGGKGVPVSSKIGKRRENEELRMRKRFRQRSMIEGERGQAGIGEIKARTV